MMSEAQVNIKFSDKRGSVVVLVAAALFVLMGFVAIVADIGLLYLARTRLANAADAAALAGAQELPVDPLRATAVAEEYAGNNGVKPEELDIEVAPDSRSVTVEAHRAVNFFFARALGIVRGRVEAAATAAVYPLAGARGIVPFSIEEQELVFGRQYVLKEGAGCGSASLGEDGRMYGWFGALDLDGESGGASGYRETVVNGCPSLVRVGDVVAVETGNMSGPTADGVLCRIAQCGDGCTYESFRRSCPRLVIVPVVRYLGVAGEKKKVEVRGFAAFFLEGVEGRGRDNNVVGRFVRTVYPGEAGDVGDYGVETVKLVR